MTGRAIILWIVVKRVLIALLYREATGSTDGAPKFCLIENTLELKMLSSGIVASGFHRKKGGICGLCNEIHD